MSRLQPIDINGAHLEGGGQIPRIAVALSALLDQPVHITNIRANRPASSKRLGGLKGQHAAAIGFLADACGAKTHGLQVGSQSLTLEPGGKKALPKEIEIVLDTPGAITLVLQTVLPYLFFTPRDDGEPYELRVAGGSHVSKSPSVSYFIHVMLPCLHLLGLPAVQVLDYKYNFGGKALGELRLAVPAIPRGATLEGCPFQDRGDISEVAWLAVAPDDGIVAAIEAAVAAKWPTKQVKRLVDRGSDGRGRGWYLLLTLLTTTGYVLGADILAESKELPLRKRQIAGLEIVDAVAATRVADFLVDKVSRTLVSRWSHGRALDECMEDQIVVYQALSRTSPTSSIGRSLSDLHLGDQTASEVVIADAEAVEDEHGNLKQVEGWRDRHATLHTLTARWVASVISGATFDVDGTCQGIGLVSGR